ncbi:MAG: hypothetical protein AB7N71_02910 [Phycisphaerae bacterium]
MSVRAKVEPDAAPRSHARVLAAYRGKQLKHTIDQHLRDDPGQTFMVLVLLAFIWAALHQLLVFIFEHVQNWQLVAVVANQQIFVHFFLALAIMLAFSNGVLAFGALFGRAEPAHLLAMPASPRQIMFVKWVEGTILSSWAFLLLGVPLMLAVATTTKVEWYYYPLFVGHFSGFVLIPCTLGYLAAWAVAMWLPRRPIVIAMWFGFATLAGIGIWLARLSAFDVNTEEWVARILEHTSAMKNPWLPSTWSAMGIVAVLERDVGKSVFYLLVVLANAAFLVWVTINLVGHTWAKAYDRAQQGRFVPIIRRGWVTSGITHTVFFFLPRPWRYVLQKDLRTFSRDATQWTQMLIMLALLILYALNLRELPFDLGNPRVKGLVAFLNLTTISLILATFTSRFIFPMLSLESQQLWALGLIPCKRSTLLVLKFIFAFAMTGTAGLTVLLLALRQINLPASWMTLHIMVCIFVCIGLSGISVGIGARLPMLGQRNPARIASGFGGTVNLVVSMLFVALMMFSVAWITYGEFNFGHVEVPPLGRTSWWVLGALGVFSLTTTITVLQIGIRHFNRLES